LLEIVLTGATGLTTGEGALVVALSGVDANMTSKVATGGKGAFAGGADVFFLGRLGRGSRSRGVKLGGDFRRFNARHGGRRKSWFSSKIGGLVKKVFAHSIAPFSLPSLTYHIEISQISVCHRSHPTYPFRVYRRFPSSAPMLFFFSHTPSRLGSILNQHVIHLALRLK